jgi:hypothetical protein
MIKLNDRLNIDEITNLLAENIIQDNVFEKSRIALKCKIYMLCWQRANKLPKNLEKAKYLIEDGLKYTIQRKLFIEYIENNLGKEKMEEFIIECNKILETIKFTNEEGY